MATTKKRKKTKKISSITSTINFNNPALLFVVIFLIIVGVFLVFRSFAATSDMVTSSGAKSPDCLANTNKTTISGTLPSYKGTVPTGNTADARTLTVSNTSTWLVTPGASQNVCWVGGEYMNTIADSATGSPTNAWSTYWHHTGAFTLKNSNTNWVFDGVTIHHTGDAFNISTSGDNFEIRNSHIYDIRDDCVQNDYYFNGTTHDNLFVTDPSNSNGQNNGCYSGFSSKANSGEHPDGTGRTWTISNNVVYIAPTWSVFRGDIPGNGYLIKWAKPGDNLGTPEKLIFKDNIIRMDKCAFQVGSTCTDSSTNPALYVPPGTEWSGNKLYWGGSGPVPNSLATWFSSAHGSSMITRAEWDKAISDWRLAHPNVR